MEVKINIAEILKDKPIDFVYLTKAMNIFQIQQITWMVRYEENQK